jgi:hypothetical protein
VKYESKGKIKIGIMKKGLTAFLSGQSLSAEREGFEPPFFSINSTTSGFSEGKPTVQGSFS